MNGSVVANFLISLLSSGREGRMTAH